ncbi:MAG: choice-of-anchor D domain-containing protein [Candidatus Delongbacteria bacterium]
MTMTSHCSFALIVLVLLTTTASAAIGSNLVSTEALQESSESSPLSVYECADQHDDCLCGLNNPYGCCSGDGNCTWWAWEAACCIWGIALPQPWHNAREWATDLENNGFYVSNIPAINTIACSTTLSSLGHVAWVTGISGNQVTVTEMYCDGFYGVRTHTYPISTFDAGFVYQEEPNLVSCNWTITTNGGPSMLLSEGWHMWRSNDVDYIITLSISGFQGNYAVVFEDGGDGHTVQVSGNHNETQFSFAYYPGNDLTVGNLHRFFVCPQGNQSIHWCESNRFYAGNLPTLDVSVSPNPMTVGQSATVNWSVNGGISGLPYGGWNENIQLDWYQNGSFCNDVTADRPVSDNSYTFTVPNNIAGGSVPGCNFQIRGSNASQGTSMPGGIVNDSSTNFCINTVPECSVNVSNISFESTDQNVPVTRDFVITNIGGGTLSGSVTENCTVYSIISGGNYSLNAGQSQTVTVQLLSATPGTYNCTVDTGGSCPDVSCSGTVNQLPICSVDPLSLSFGTVQPNTPVTRTFTISNTGGGTLSGTVTESCSAYIITAPATYSLSAGQSHTFTVTLQSSSSGSFPCTLDTGGSCADVMCAGTVEISPECSVTPTSLDFGTVLPGTVVTRTFTITNTGGGTLSGTVSETCAAYSITSGGNYNLGAGQSQTITVQFQSAVAGTYACTLDTGGDCSNVAMTGVALSIAVVTGPSSDCGIVNVLGHDTGATVGFVPDWNSGLIGLNFSPEPATGVTVSIFVNGSSVNTSPAIMSWRPATSFLSPYLNQNVGLYFRVSDGVNTWNTNGSICFWDLNFVGVTEHEMPTVFSLAEPAPNPFNPSTRLQLAIPAPDDVTLRVMDLQGRLVDVIYSGPLAAGLHYFSWQPVNTASGTYFVVASGREGQQVKSVVYIK